MSSLVLQIHPRVKQVSGGQLFEVISPDAFGGRMSISEILMLLTLIVTIVHVTFEITWKLEQREKHHDNDKKKK